MAQALTERAQSHPYFLPCTFLPGSGVYYSEYLPICLSPTACQVLPVLLHGWFRACIVLAAGAGW